MGSKNWRCLALISTPDEKSSKVGLSETGTPRRIETVRRQQNAAIIINARAKEIVLQILLLLTGVSRWRPVGPSKAHEPDRARDFQTARPPTERLATSARRS